MVADIYVIGGAAMALAYAARRREAEDIRLFVRKLELSSAKDVLALCAEVFPDEPVPDRARLVLEDVFETGQE